MLGLIRNTILEFVEVDPESITEDADLVKDLNLNSYDVINMIGNLESELGVEIADEELRGIATVGDLVSYLKAKVK